MHRVGRTARAGREGYTYTLLRREEVYHFKQMMAKAGRRSIAELKAPASLESLVPDYQRALAALKALLDKERFGAGRLQEAASIDQAQSAERARKTLRAQAAANFLAGSQ